MKTTTKTTSKEREEIAARICKIREELSLTQEAFGVAAGGISRQAVSNWQQGKAVPDWFSLEKLKENLYINPRWIMLGTGESLIPKETVKLMTVLENPNIDLNDLLKYAQFRSQSN